MDDDGGIRGGGAGWEGKGKKDWEIGVGRHFDQPHPFHHVELVANTKLRLPRGPPAEPQGHPSAARSRAAACTEPGRRYRHTPGPGYGLDRERVVERQTVKVTEREMYVEAEAPVLQTSSTGAPVGSCGTNGESDVEALLAKLRAL
ncbi:unnamed protein product [Pleuronectes platessa]|uniref:Uncharacterized protein n=1 Tax=Pleuronectes platessa TaxID=8262 RepID=A0A9N7YPN1_PLEPL|nr:unnamed protein product [Pleuronectes platessa]